MLKSVVFVCWYAALVCCAASLVIQSCVWERGSERFSKGKKWVLKSVVFVCWYAVLVCYAASLVIQSCVWEGGSEWCLRWELWVITNSFLLVCCAVPLAHPKVCVWVGGNVRYMRGVGQHLRASY